ncbi:prolipoprotein diacylglyceryl transferase [Tenuifilaceae bacterium CYCD]|nr:prolipoprotein diacylglyceryl transferase [Tenuifilaceae bacterium CYCD]
MLAYIHWNVNPEIFSLGPFAVRYYGLMWAMAFYLGYVVFNKFVKREGLPEGFLDSLTMYMVIGTVIGARLGHCLFYEPDYYLSHPLEIIKIWKGGLASHGAAIGILISLYFFARKQKVLMIYVVDRVVITVALGGAFIRLGNLMNSEIYGVETNLPWGFLFERNNEIFPKHPTQLYEALSYFLIFFILYFYYRKQEGKTKTGFIFGVFLILLFAARFLIEYVKEPQVDFEKAMVLNMGQWLSVPFILAGVFFVVYSYLKPNIFIPVQEKINKKGK